MNKFLWEDNDLVFVRIASPEELAAPCRPVRVSYDTITNEAVTRYADEEDRLKYAGGVKIGENAEVPLRDRKISFSGSRPVGFAHAEVFPVIAAALVRQFNWPDYVTHERLVGELIADPQLISLLEQLERRDPQQKKMSWWASNMVQWFSQAITMGHSEYKVQFERTKIKD